MDASSRRQDDLRRFLKRARIAQRPAGPSLESVGAAPPSLDAEFVRGSLEAAEHAMTQDEGVERADREAAIDEGRRAYARVVDEGAAPGPRELVALEAIQLFDGSRPAIALVDDAIPLGDAALGDWQGTAALHGPEIAELAKAVCLISAGDEKLGSGFLAAPGLVLTNRHVLEAMAQETSQGWTFGAAPTVDFGKGAREVAGVEWAGPQKIGVGMDFGRLDLALLRLAPGAEPEPAQLDGRGAFLDPPTLAMDGKVGTIGFPLQIRDLSVEDATLRLFKGKFGRKCWAPGRIDALPGTLPGDERKEWILRHDASTLPGNSGSCLGDLETSPRLALGLHIGGVTQGGNFAHSLAAAQNHLRPLGLAFVGGLS